MLWKWGVWRFLQLAFIRAVCMIIHRIVLYKQRALHCNLQKLSLLCEISICIWLRNRIEIWFITHCVQLLLYEIIQRYNKNFVYWTSDPGRLHSVINQQWKILPKWKLQVVVTHKNYNKVIAKVEFPREVF